MDGIKKTGEEPFRGGDDPHPDLLLADYSEGALTGADRETVEAHLASCARCGHELALAKRAREALAGLPELPVPMGTTRPVIERARKGRVASGRAIWFGGAAAAAAAIAALAWFAFQGGGDNHPASEAAGRAPVTAAQGTVRVPKGLSFTTSRVDYSDARIQDLAQELAHPGSRAFASAAGSALTSGAQDKEAKSQPARALACIKQGANIKTLQGVFEVIEARFNHKPAYIGAFKETPGAGQPADLLTIWVVSKQGCSFLSYARQRI